MRGKMENSLGEYSQSPSVAAYGTLFCFLFLCEERKLLLPKKRNECTDVDESTSRPSLTLLMPLLQLRSPDKGRRLSQRVTLAQRKKKRIEDDK